MTLIAAAVLLIMVGRPGPTGQSSSAAPSGSPARSGTAALTDHGIAFGTVVVFKQLKPVAAVPVTNTTDQVRSFTVRATFKAGDQTIATATGTVYDLLPNSSRVAVFTIEGSPTGDTSIDASVDTIIAVASATVSSQAAAGQKLGQPKLIAGQSPVVSVSVTNAMKTAHSFRLAAAIWQGGRLVGIAAGPVDGLVPGQTRTFNLPVTGAATGDKVTVWVDQVTK